MHPQTRKFLKKTFMHKTQVTLPMNCKHCNVASNRGDNKTPIFSCIRTDDSYEYFCNACGTSWKETNRKDFGNVPTLCGNALCCFHGPWTDKELKTIKCCAFHYCERTNDEWGFYKGRHFYTAWRGFGRHSNPKVIMDRDFNSLIEKVQKLCRPNGSNQK
jgi:hypothetical protein